MNLKANLTGAALLALGATTVALADSPFASEGMEEYGYVAPNSSPDDPNYSRIAEDWQRVQRGEMEWGEFAYHWSGYGQQWTLDSQGQRAYHVSASRATVERQRSNFIMGLSLDQYHDVVSVLRHTENQAPDITRAWSQRMAEAYGTSDWEIVHGLSAVSEVWENTLRQRAESNPPPTPESCRTHEAAFRSGVIDGVNTNKFLITHEAVRLFASGTNYVGEDLHAPAYQACFAHREDPAAHSCCRQGFRDGNHILFVAMNDPGPAAAECRLARDFGWRAAEVTCRTRPEDACRSVQGLTSFGMLGCWSLGFAQRIQACNQGVAQYWNSYARTVSDEYVSIHVQATQDAVEDRWTAYCRRNPQDCRSRGERAE